MGSCGDRLWSTEARAHAAEVLAERRRAAVQRLGGPAERLGGAIGAGAGVGADDFAASDQYVDWQFDGDDLIYVARTASRGARNFHDSNRVLFGRERGFRSLL